MSTKTGFGFCDNSYLRNPFQMCVSVKIKITQAKRFILFVFESLLPYTILITTSISLVSCINVILH